MLEAVKQMLWTIVYYASRIIKYLGRFFSDGNLDDSIDDRGHYSRRYDNRNRNFRGRGGKYQPDRRFKHFKAKDDKSKDQEINELLDKIKEMEYKKDDKNTKEKKSKSGEAKIIDKSNLPFVRDNTLYMGMEKAKGYRNKEVYIDTLSNISLNIVKTQDAMGIVTAFTHGDHQIMVTARHVAYAIQDKLLKVKINGLLICTNETKDANIEALKLDIPYYMITKTDDNKSVLITVKKVNSYPIDSEEPEVIVCTLGFLDINIIKSGSPIVTAKGIFIISSQFYDENEVCYVIAANIKKHFNYTAVTNVFF